MPSLQGRWEPARRPRPAQRKGISLIGLLVVIAILLVLAALAIPRAIRSRIVSNETAAASALRTLASANLIYSNRYEAGYAPSLAALGPPGGGRLASAANADLIDSVLAGGTRRGYTFTYAPVDTAGNGQFDRFSVNANPITPGISGQRYFFVDHSHVLRFDVNGPATAASTPIPSR